MSAPTPPTVTTICTEGLKKAGLSNPSSIQLTRAQGWMAEIKRDIVRRESRLKSLYTTTYKVCTIGQSRYDLPTDYYSDLSIMILDGANTGTAQSGSSSTVTFASDEDITSDFAIGRYTLITSGTGLGSYSQCVSYNETTKQAGVSPNFATAPVNGDGYMVVDINYPVEVVSMPHIDIQNYSTNKWIPRLAAIVGNSTVGQFYLWPAPDKAYGIQIRYYMNLMTLDLAGTLMSTLYQNLFDLWIQGIYAKQLQNDNSVKAKDELSTYYKMLDFAVKQESDISNFTDDNFIEPAFS